MRASQKGFWRTPFGYMLHELGPFSNSMGEASSVLATLLLAGVMGLFFTAPILTLIGLTLLATFGTFPSLYLEHRNADRLQVTAHGTRLALTKGGVMLGWFDSDEEGREELQAAIVAQQCEQEANDARATQARVIADAVNRALR